MAHSAELTESVRKKLKTGREKIQLSTADDGRPDTAPESNDRLYAKLVLLLLLTLLTTGCCKDCTAVQCAVVQFLSKCL